MTQVVLESRALDALVRHVGPGAPLRGILLAVATLVVLLYLHRVTRRRLEGYLAAQAHKPENAEAFLRAYTTVWKVGMAIAVLIAATGSFALLGLSVGFFGTMLGWSLQAPIRGLAAWVMVVLKRPFRIGDRITVADVTGDVVDVQLNHIVLNQVGGTVQGEERSGRGVLVPNAMLFGQEIINYNYFGREGVAVTGPPSRLMLDEVLVRLTLGSDYELARTLCLDAAKQAVAELVGEPRQELFTRVEFTAWGVLLRVRYKTVPAKRQEVSSRVTELIWRAFNDHKGRVTFCLPTHVAGVTPSPGEPPPPMAAEGPSG